MSKKVLIYGVSGQAQQLYKYISLDSDDEVIAFVADAEYIKEERLFGLPVIDFEQVSEVFPPDDYEMLISFAYTNMMRNREEKFRICKEKGYRLYSFISSRANVYCEKIGEGCVIYPGCTIAPFTELGDGTFCEIGVNIAHHAHIGDYNFFAPGAVVCGGVKVGNNCFFGAGSITRNAVRVEDLTLIGAGTYLNCSTKRGQVLKAPKPINLDISSDEISRF